MSSMSHARQNAIRERNQNKIMEELKQGPRRFTDLVQATKLTAPGLNKNLKQLREEGLIEVELNEENARGRWKLSERGSKEYSKSWRILTFLYELRTKVPSHIFNEDLIQWGIESEAFEYSNEGKTKAFSSLGPNIERSVFSQLKEQIQENKIPSYAGIEGKLVITLTIDYSKLFSFLQNEEKTQKQLIEVLPLRREEKDLENGLIQDRILSHLVLFQNNECNSRGPVSTRELVKISYKPELVRETLEELKKEGLIEQEKDAYSITNKGLEIVGNNFKTRMDQITSEIKEMSAESSIENSPIPEETKERKTKPKKKNKKEEEAK